jgi:pSer/pThr/pTyr-binding forkhead associated (FHA) protein
MRAQLIPLDGGSPVELIKELTLVGRKEDCDLCLEHKSVSKIHCVLVKTDGMLLLRDLGSTNGTRVNGTRVRRAVLLPQDQISIATYKFRIYLGPDEEPMPPDEHTQQMNPHEVAELLKQGKQPALAESSEEIPQARPLQVNPLPDVYPDDEGRG